jgi:hypothetical protein
MELALVRLLVVAPRGQHLGFGESGRADVAGIKKLAYRLGLRSIEQVETLCGEVFPEEPLTTRQRTVLGGGARRLRRQVDTLPPLDRCATTLLCSYLFRNSGAEAA